MPSYIPSIYDFCLNDSSRKNKKVLVIGGGCGGLGAAWHLNRSEVDVTLYESGNYIGGHANTISVDGIDVDTGFMVYNSMNYPNLIGLFEELGVEGLATTMGFSVSMDDGNFEWCGDSLSGLMATPSNIYNLDFYVMMNDILRFNKCALSFLNLPTNHPSSNQTTGEFLSSNRFSKAFTKYYLIPMTGAIWSATTDAMLKFPALTLFTFLNNHLLLQLSGHLNWKTPKNRSSEYVQKICAELGDNRIHKNKTVVSVKRVLDVTSGEVHSIVTDSNGNESTFDIVVFACRPDQALSILGEDHATEDEKKYLKLFKFSTNETYVHCDTNLMPKSKSAWTSWNYMGKTKNSADGGNDETPVYVTYWLNKLQHLDHPRDIFVSLNPFNKPDLSKTYAVLDYAHPQYSTESIEGQRKIAKIQGQNGTYFCGAWMGYGFHEDGIRSGLEVACAISGEALPWVKKFGYQKMIPAPKMVLMEAQKISPFSAISTFFKKPMINVLQFLARHSILYFLKLGFSKGKLSLSLPNNTKYTFVGKSLKCQEVEEITVRVYKPNFWVRLALEADLGMAKSYIAGEWEIENTGPNSDGLTKFLLTLIDNMPNGKDRVSGGIDANKLITAWIGSTLNFIWFRLTMDNSIANSRSNIHAHYDLSNGLFQTFLDKEHMMYSCGLFETSLQYDKSNSSIPPKLICKGSLESAQTRKIDELLFRLEPLGPETTLLDIGFGWGGICIRAAEKYGCKVHGISLSIEQTALACEKVKAKGLEHLITFELMDYRLFAKTGKKFDRIVSCEMIEAVGHNHLNDFFDTVEKLLNTEGIFVMQAITMPDSRYPGYVNSADFANTIIFPGGCCPSLSALLNAMAAKSTLHLEQVSNINLHYVETLRQWRHRFNAAMPTILELGFDDAFIRLWNLYLCYCEAGFLAQAINLQMLTFSRPGNPNMIAKRSLEFNCNSYKKIGADIYGALMLDNGK